ncbi:MAG: methylenetetrahydrofolate reductase [Candidatus Omnitrophica bacterium]|nr:methylenetetrahydrofolate reductase [Candidatus Omnitrophota bacterium]
MTLREKLQSGKFVFTSEIGPPKGIETAHLLETARFVSKRVDAVNVTDLQSSVMRLGSLVVCNLLKQNGIEPVFQITCRDRNRLALQSDLLSAASLGIENVLVLTGDHPSRGDHPQAKPVFDLDSVQLLEAAKKLENGFDMNNNKLDGAAPKFYLGAVVNPGADPLEPQIIKMEKKIEAGAEFFQTQAIFDARVLENFLNKTRHLKTVILGGIVFLKSSGMCRYMNKNVPGMFVPDDLVKEMEQANDRIAVSIEIAARLINQIKPMCQGIHLMPIGQDKLVPRVLDTCGL